MEHNPPAKPSPSNPPALLEGALLTLGGACALAGALGAAAQIVTVLQVSQLDLLTCLAAAMRLLIGVVGLALFWWMAVVVRQQYQVVMLQRRNGALLEQMSSRPAPVGEGTPAQVGISADAAMMQRLLAELSEINATLVLSEPQREIKRRQFQLQRGVELAKAVTAALDADKVHQAQQAMDKLRDEVPDFPEMGALEQRLQQRRQAMTDHEIQELSLRVRDLMAAGNFDQALATARLLAERYPQSKGQSLVEQVRRERAAFETERRRMMYQQINKFVEAKQWRSALTAGRQFLEAYPNCAEADLIRAQLPTLTTNAQIEEVRHLRDEFREMINGQRFVEAFEIAKDLVNRFPGTAAAEELRGQMDRLAAKAKAKSA
jgi:TolA-binding protein